MRNFLKPTKVTWIVFGSLIAYFLVAFMFFATAETLADLNHLFLYPYFLFVLYTFNTFTIDQQLSITFMEHFVTLSILFYIIASLVSFGWYKMKRTHLNS